MQAKFIKKFALSQNFRIFGCYSQLQNDTAKQKDKLNWIDKIKELTTKQDKSPELKKGEIKQILIQTASEVLPDFEFLAYKNSCYSFQRLRKVNNLTVHEILHIIFTLKDKGKIEIKESTNGADKKYGGRLLVLWEDATTKGCEMDLVGGSFQVCAEL